MRVHDKWSPYPTHAWSPLRSDCRGSRSHSRVWHSGWRGPDEEPSAKRGESRLPATLRSRDDGLPAPRGCSEAAHLEQPAPRDREHHGAFGREPAGRVLRARRYAARRGRIPRSGEVDVHGEPRGRGLPGERAGDERTGREGARCVRTMHEDDDGTFKSMGMASGINDRDGMTDRVKAGQNLGWADIDIDGDLLIGGRDNAEPGARSICSRTPSVRRTAGAACACVATART